MQAEDHCRFFHFEYEAFYFKFESAEAKSLKSKEV